MIVCHLAGCSSSGAENVERAAVSGIVTLDGSPLPSGVIRFIPEGRTTGPQTTATVSNGSFMLPDDLGPVVGKHRIEIDSTDLGGLEPDDEQALDRLRAEKTRKRIEIVRIPPVYNRQSKLTVHVPPEGRFDLTFELVSNPPGR
jgi:hypothetical protein